MIKKTILILMGVISPGLLMMSCSSAYKQESTGQYIDGSVITTKIKAKFLSDQTLNALHITVKTYKNTIQLSGFVNNYHQKYRAEEIAQSVEGVQNVENSLIVKSH